MFDIWLAVLKLIEIVLRIYRMISPTNLPADSRRRKTQKKRSPRSQGPSRAKQPPPAIYVKTDPGKWHASYSLAHLRNKGGYLYLSWRDGTKIRTHYLGKAAKV